MACSIRTSRCSSTRTRCSSNPNVEPNTNTDTSTITNKVFLDYCTSDAHWANTERWVRPDGGLYQFRGQVVVQSMFTDLVEKHCRMVKVPPLSAPARLLRLHRACLAALGSLALPGRPVCPMGTSQWLDCSLELAASKAA